MENILGKNALMWFENDDFSWVELHKIRHEKKLEFKIPDDDTWYSKEIIVEFPSAEECNSNFCVNCKLPLKNIDSFLCKDTHCINEYIELKNAKGVTGFTTENTCTTFTDKRLIKYPGLRENLWAQNSDVPLENENMIYEDKLYSIKHGKFLPKSRFADRRLSHMNRGKRYNLHAH